MKFLLKLLYAGSLVGTVFTSSHAGMTADLPGLDKDAGNDKTVTVQAQQDIFSELNHSLSLTNPFSASGDQPFTIAETKKDAADPEKVYCGGHEWIDGQLLGTNNDGEVRTAIIHHRIYIRIGGNITTNRFHLLHANGTPFPNNPTNDALLKKCVNDLDPSTFSNGFLGPLQNGVIRCNNKPITDNLLLGVYIGGDKIRTEQIARIDNGLLRIVAWRREGNNPYNPTGWNGNLMDAIIEKAENGSFQNPDMGFKLTMEEVRSCFWAELPLYPDGVANPPVQNCSSGPTLTGVNNVSKTGLNFDFSGSGISTIKWRILQNGNAAASGTTGELNNTTNVNISFGSLNAGNYTLEVQGNNCVSSPSLLGFEVLEPVVVIPACQNGPGITRIINVTPSSLSVDFTGSNLHVFSWRILNGTYPVASGKTDYLNTKTAALEFNYLNNGTYTFELTADDCIAANTVVENFSVSATDTRTACNRGPSIESILGTSSSGLSFLFDGDGIFSIDWKIMQGNTMLRQNRVGPRSNTPAVTFESLPDGVYTLQIQGGNCKSTTSSKLFGVNATPLPIYISDFKGSAVEKGVELTWNVVSEKGGEGFEILRYDQSMKNAEVIGKVSLTDARVGKYKFVDESPLLGTNYYQLNQLDLDGSSMKSKIISINPGIISGTIVAPNPASDYVNIQFSSRKAVTSDFEIYNVSGIKISTSQIKITEGKNSHRINIGSLNAGQYFLKVSNEMGEDAKFRFLKAN